MSCFPEFTYAVYVDEELTLDERRSIDTHLVGCKACRILVSSLRDETGLLSDSLHEREPFWQPGTTSAEAGGLFAFGLPVAVIGVTGVISAIGFLLEARWPGGLTLLNPLRLKGALELAFDLVFMLRDLAPGLPELALALGTVAAASTLLSLGVRLLASRVGGSSVLLLVAVGLVAMPDHAAALDLRMDQDVRIAPGERIGETLVASGDLIDIDGVLDGDLIAIGERITVRGSVNGNLYVFTRDLEISGVVTGSVHAGTERTRITGRVGGDVYNASDNFSIGADAGIERDVVLWVNESAFDGEIGRDVDFMGRWLEIRGPVGRNVEVHRAERLSLRDGARIGGDVNAVLESEEIEIAPGSVIGGDSARVTPKGAEEHMMSHYSHPGYYLFLGLRYVAGVLFGIFLYTLLPGLFDNQSPTASSLFRSMGTGFLFVIATPILIVLCGLTIIGIPIAIMGTFIYAVTLYAAKITVGSLIGRRVMGTEPGIAPFSVALLVGLGVLSLITALPFIGFAVAIISVLYGLGMIYDRALEHRATL